MVLDEAGRSLRDQHLSNIIKLCIITSKWLHLADRTASCFEAANFCYGSVVIFNGRHLSLRYETTPDLNFANGT